MEYQRVTPASFAEMDGLADWRFVLGAIRAQFRARSFPDGAALVEAIASAAESANHHPDLALRYPGHVDVTLSTHATGGLSDADVALARTISSLARIKSARVHLVLPERELFRRERKDPSASIYMAELLAESGHPALCRGPGLGQPGLTNRKWMSAKEQPPGRFSIAMTCSDTGVFSTRPVLCRVRKISAVSRSVLSTSNCLMLS